MNVRGVAEVHLRQVVLIDVADDPDVAEVGDGERVGAAEALHAGRVGHLLIGDDAADGRVNADDRRGWSLSTPSR